MYPTRLIERLSIVFAGSGAPALEALAALDRELERARAPALDHAVVHAKLGWWRGELARLAAGDPAHPLTRRLRTLGGAIPEWPRLQARLDAAERALAGQVPARLEELEGDCRDSHGALWVVAAQLLAGNSDPALAAFGVELGIGLGLAGHCERVRGARTAPDPELIARAAERLARADRSLPTGLGGQLAGALVARALTAATLAPAAASRAFMQPWIAWRAARCARSEARE